MSRTPGSLIGRLQSLKAKHAALDARICTETARPMPDGLRVQSLKRLRLRTKDQIARTARQLRDRPEAGALDAI